MAATWRNKRKEGKRKAPWEKQYGSLPSAPKSSRCPFRPSVPPFTLPCLSLHYVRDLAPTFKSLSARANPQARQQGFLQGSAFVVLSDAVWCADEESGDIGTRQATLPGGLRTGAPGHHVVKGKAKYRLDDTKVRVFVAPSVAELTSSPVSPPSYSPQTPADFVPV